MSRARVNKIKFELFVTRSRRFNGFYFNISNARTRMFLLVFVRVTFLVFFKYDVCVFFFFYLGKHFFRIGNDRSEFFTPSYLDCTIAIFIFFPYDKHLHDCRLFDPIIMFARKRSQNDYAIYNFTFFSVFHTLNNPNSRVCTRTSLYYNYYEIKYEKKKYIYFV